MELMDQQRVEDEGGSIWACCGEPQSPGAPRQSLFPVLGAKRVTFPTGPVFTQ